MELCRFRRVLTIPLQIRIPFTTLGTFIVALLLANPVQAQGEHLQRYLLHEATGYVDSEGFGSSLCPLDDVPASQVGRTYWLACAAGALGGPWQVASWALPLTITP